MIQTLAVFKYSISRKPRFKLKQLKQFNEGFYSVCKSFKSSKYLLKSLFKRSFDKVFLEPCLCTLVKRVVLKFWNFSSEKVVLVRRKIADPTAA